MNEKGYEGVLMKFYYFVNKFPENESGILWGTLYN
jgi:hypothetical protein